MMAFICVLFPVTLKVLSVHIVSEQSACLSSVFGVWTEGRQNCELNTVSVTGHGSRVQRRTKALVSHDVILFFVLAQSDQLM